MSPDPVREETGGEAFEVTARVDRASELAFVRDTLEHYANGPDRDPDDGLRARQALDALDAHTASASSSKDEEGVAGGVREQLDYASTNLGAAVELAARCQQRTPAWQELTGLVSEANDAVRAGLEALLGSAPSGSQQGTGERELAELLAVEVKCPRCAGTGELESSDSTDDSWWDCGSCRGRGRQPFADAFPSAAKIVRERLASVPSLQEGGG